MTSVPAAGRCGCSTSPTKWRSDLNQRYATEPCQPLGAITVLVRSPAATGERGESGQNPAATQPCAWTRAGRARSKRKSPRPAQKMTGYLRREGATDWLWMDGRMTDVFEACMEGDKCCVWARADGKVFSNFGEMRQRNITA